MSENVVWIELEGPKIYVPLFLLRVVDLGWLVWGGWCGIVGLGWLVWGRWSEIVCGLLV